MTDLKKTIELYSGFGISCEINKTSNGFDIRLDDINDKYIGCKGITAYGYSSVMFFDNNENFKSQIFTCL